MTDTSYWLNANEKLQESYDFAFKCCYGTNIVISIIKNLSSFILPEIFSKLNIKYDFTPLTKDFTTIFLPFNYINSVFSLIEAVRQLIDEQALRQIENKIQGTTKLLNGLTGMIISSIILAGAGQGFALATGGLIAGSVFPFVISMYKLEKATRRYLSLEDCIRDNDDLINKTRARKNRITQQIQELEGKISVLNAQLSGLPEEMPVNRITKRQLEVKRDRAVKSKVIKEKVYAQLDSNYQELVEEQLALLEYQLNTQTNKELKTKKQLRDIEDKRTTLENYENLLKVPNLDIQLQNSIRSDIKKLNDELAQDDRKKVLESFLHSDQLIYEAYQAKKQENPQFLGKKIAQIKKKNSDNLNRKFIECFAKGLFFVGAILFCIPGLQLPGIGLMIVAGFINGVCWFYDLLKTNKSDKHDEHGEHGEFVVVDMDKGPNDGPQVDLI